MHFARICGAVIQSNLALPNLQHIVPSGVISKYELLRCFGKTYSRPDIHISPTEAKQAVEGRAGRYGNEICAEIKKHKAVAQRSKVEGTEDAISSAIDLPTVDAFGSDLVQLNDLKVVLPLFMLVAPERIRRL